MRGELIKEGRQLLSARLQRVLAVGQAGQALPD